ncbi:MAG: GTP 3',8-cyclase MoaA [Candidatus Bathyarchaeota archaeon]|nr:GTP 3',8-cyclase MoaA [Candidatus Bathyarchaeota archaeon]MDH5532153.1 GTP 3',8-cyclase MoaA [Candidatus Bathyarchaeota archaeon]MDH5712380.1 GTP 3',8-cyclase MoaA [Candidatus Bathyarchaeota archaeon]
MIRDDHGRPVLNLRISVTQRCNLRCPYCHREGEVANPSTEMTKDEIVRIVGVAVGLGISRVKLTGGEPLLRSDILEIVTDIAGLRGLRDLSMTSNGTNLASLAKGLRASGLNRVNISIPSLDARTYRALMGGNLRDVLRGIRAAVDAELFPTKLNMLVLKNVNDHEIPKMISFAERTITILQLIELEPLNISASYYKRYHRALDAVEEELKKQARRVVTRGDMQNRRVYFLPRVKVEVVRPIENTEFCLCCTRLRVTSDGRLKPCLMRNDNLVDVLTPLRNGADDEELRRLFLEAVKRREPYYKVRATV